MYRKRIGKFTFRNRRMVRTSERCSSKGSENKFLSSRFDQLFRTGCYHSSRFFVLGSTKPNALEDFRDKETRTVEGSLNGGKCMVVWSDDKEYKADLLFTSKI